MTQHIRVDLLKEGGLFGQSDASRPYPHAEPVSKSDVALRNDHASRATPGTAKRRLADTLADPMRAARGWGF